MNRVGHLRVIIISLLVIGAIAAHSLLIPHPPQHIFYSGPIKFWAHRTLSDSPAENTIAGLQRVFDLGGPGSEIDVIFDSTRSGLYVISEEAMSAGEPTNLPLSDLLRAIPNDKYLWIDFWNLRLLDNVNAEKAIAALCSVLLQNQMIGRTIVESKHAGWLRRLADLGCNTSLWIEVRPAAKSRITHVLDVFRAAWRFNSGHYSAISMDYTEYDGLTAFVFQSVPVHLFTINDREALERFAADPAVRVILTDSIQTVILR